jgi:hypothetical protein
MFQTDSREPPTATNDASLKLRGSWSIAASNIRSFKECGPACGHGACWSATLRYYAWGMPRPNTKRRCMFGRSLIEHSRSRRCFKPADEARTKIRNEHLTRHAEEQQRRTPEEGKQLLELKAAGKPHAVIGVALGRSVGSIVGRLGVLTTRSRSTESREPDDG